MTVQHTVVFFAAAAARRLCLSLRFRLPAQIISFILIHALCLCVQKLCLSHFSKCVAVFFLLLSSPRAWFFEWFLQCHLAICLNMLLSNDSECKAWQQLPLWMNERRKKKCDEMKSENKRILLWHWRIYIILWHYEIPYENNEPIIIMTMMTIHDNDFDRNSPKIFRIKLPVIFGNA